MNRLSRLLLFLSPALPLFAADDPATKYANTIILNETGVRNLRLETEEAAETDFEETVFSLGRIAILPGSKSVVSSRIAGRALTVSAKPDVEVKKGEELLKIESRQPGDPPPTVTLTAPIDGSVAEVRVSPGQPISPDDALLDIVDLREVHAVGRVPEHLAGALKIGQKARIRVPAHDDKTFEAELAHLGTLADGETGTVEAAFHVENPERLLRPGMRAEFSIITSSRPGVMAVPREAVLGEGANRFVFIADYELENAFVKTPVVVGVGNDTHFEIINGILPGDKVVTHGAYALQHAGEGSVSLKEALDAAHGHPHDEQGRDLTEQQKNAGNSGAGGRATLWNPLAIFFASTTGLLLGFLILGAAMRKRATT